MNNLNYIVFVALLLISFSGYSQNNSNIITTPSTKLAVGTASLGKAEPINDIAVVKGKTNAKSKTASLKITRKLKPSNGVPYLVPENSSNSNPLKEKITKGSTYKTTHKETKSLINPSLEKSE